MDNMASSVMGYILVPFYILFPIWYLWRIAKKVKDSLTGGVDGLDYEASLDDIQRKAKQDVLVDPKTGKDRKEQIIPTDSSGYKAAVVSGLLGSFEERYWWWKLFLMLERAALAVLVHTGASSWCAVTVAGGCWLASLWCQPYWARAEDLLDGMVRMTTFLTCLAAALVESKVVKGDEVWLAVILNTVGITTLLALVISIGPLRLLRGAIKSYLERRRMNRVRGGIGTISKMSEEEALEITEEEFTNYSDVAKLELTWKFPELSVLQHFKESPKPAKFQFDNSALKAVVKDWLKFPTETEAVFGHISEWDVSAVKDMDNLFMNTSRFNDDISRWDVSNVQSMKGMFWNAKVFNQDISSWNTANAIDMDAMFLGAKVFNKAYISGWANKP